MFLSRKRLVRSNGVNGSRNYKLIKPSEIGLGFNEIIGHYECKKELNNILQFLNTPGIYSKYNVVPYCKYLLLGPDGIGKSTLICALAKTADVPIYVVEPSFFYDIKGVLAETDKLFKEILQVYKSGGSCMLLFKNIEHFSSIKDEDVNLILEKIIGYFRELPQLVAFATLSTSVTTSTFKILMEPPAFSKRISLSYPELKVRENILSVLLKDVAVEENLNIHRLALDTYQMAFGDIKSLVKDAILLSLQNNQEMVTYHDFAEALAQSSFGYVKNNFNEAERLATARHEAGHVIAGYYISPKTYKVSKVEITPRAFYAGITEITPDEEKLSFFREEMEAKIISAFGGMASEEIYYDSTSTGVANDLEQATNIAVSMYKVFGMSKDIGPICLMPESVLNSVSSGTADVVVAASMIRERMDSLNHIADLLIQRYLMEMYDRTKEIITKHLGALEELTNALLANEVLYSDEVMAILEKHNK